MKLALVLASVVLSLPAQVLAQIPIEPPRYGLAASSEHSPHRSPMIAYSREIGGRWITEFYLMPTPGSESEPVVFARRALDSYDAQEQIRWADSRTCPGLVPSLLRANDMGVPSVLIPLDAPSRAQRRSLGHPVGIIADGPGPYVFWAMTFGLAGHEVRFSTYGGPWHAWADAMEEILKPCWGDEAPSAPTTR